MEKHRNTYTRRQFRKKITDINIHTNKYKQTHKNIKYE